jgi:hypothetical protein
MGTRRKTNNSRRESLSDPTRCAAAQKNSIIVSRGWRLLVIARRRTGRTDNSLARVFGGRIHHRYDGEGTGKVVTDLNGFCRAASLVEPSYRISM